MLAVVPLSPGHREHVIDVFADAFHDYSLMRWVVGPEGDVAGRVRRLVALFVSRRVMRGGPMLGVFDVDHLVGAAILTLPVEPEPPPAVVTLADQAWRDLGETTRERYQSYADVTSPFFTTIGLHHHLNMLGIRASHAGQGLARPLLEAVHQMSDRDPNSAGISLTTERARNVKLYEHFGYKVVAHLQVSDEVETWGLFRNRQTSTLAAT